ncbi:hypothetical protein D3C74_166040 [compost metagenome]
MIYIDPAGHKAMHTGTWYSNMKVGPHCAKVGISVCAKEALSGVITVSSEVADFLILDDINTVLDPNASTFDKSLAAVGFIPIGKFIKGGKLIIKLGSKEGRKIERAFEFTQIGSEKVLKSTFKSYEQARNLAFDITGDLGVDSKAYVGRLKTSYGYQKVIGRQSADGKVRWRVDYDPNKGFHINVEDFRDGTNKYVFRIEGGEKAYKSIIDSLN